LIIFFNSPIVSKNWNFAYLVPEKPISNISAQGARISEPRPVLEASLNYTRSFERREQDLTTIFLSKKP
jgi:hypothetical protein